jgi:hypothetical protein
MAHVVILSVSEHPTRGIAYPVARGMLSLGAKESMLKLPTNTYQHPTRDRGCTRVTRTRLIRSVRPGYSNGFTCRSPGINWHHHLSLLDRNRRPIVLPHRPVIRLQELLTLGFLDVVTLELEGEEVHAQRLLCQRVPFAAD